MTSKILANYELMIDGKPTIVKLDKYSIVRGATRDGKMVYCDRQMLAKIDYAFRRRYQNETTI